MGWFRDQPGGLNRYVAGLHEALLAAGHSSRVLLPGPASDRPASVVLAGHVGQALPWRLLSLSRAGAALVADCDVVDAHFALYALPFLPSVRRHRVPLVVHFHGPWAQESTAMGAGRLGVAAKRWVERSVYRRADRCIVLSDTFGELLVRDYGVAASRVRVVRPGVDPDRFTVSTARTVLRQELGLGSAPVVLAVRRLVPRMGLDVLLEAWQRLDRPDARLVIIGDGPQLSELQQQVDHHGMHESVHFAGRVTDDELPRWYAAADLTVVPSRLLEGFGLIVLESLAAGTPVLASDIGGMSELLPQLASDLLVPAGDATALAERLALAFDDAGSLPSRERCRTFAEQHGWDGTAQQVLGIYNEARSLRDGSGAVAGSDHVASASLVRRPLVVFVGHSSQLSGGELALVTLLPALTGVDSHVVLAEDGPLVERLRAAGVSVEVLMLAPRTAQLRKDSVSPRGVPVAALFDTGAYTVRLARRLRELRPDLVHTNSLKAHLYGGLAARLAGVPQVWHARDSITTDYLPRPAVAVVRAAARLLPSGLVANSQSTLETLRRPSARGMAPLVLPSPVPAGRDGATPRPVDSRALVVGCVGRLSPWKGQHVLLRAVAAAFPQDTAHVRIVGAALFGEDAYDASLRELTAELGLCDRVVMTGFVDDVPAELARMDVLVHCSTTPEPFGQVVVQGMAAGLPVVAADAGGPAEIIDDGRTGLLTPPGDVAALAAALRRLHEDPALRRQLGDAGRDEARRYRPEVVAPALERFYAELLQAT